MSLVYSDTVERMKDASGLKNASEIAKSLDITPQAMSKFKREGKIPTDLVIRFAQQFKLMVDYLITGEGVKRRSDIPVEREYEETQGGEGAPSVTGGQGAYKHSTEEQYVSKLRRIFREKDEGTRLAIMQNIDQFLRIAPEEPNEKEDDPPDKKAAAPSG